MFHFTGYRVPFPIWFGKGRWRIAATGLPHSEISGSKRICRSPKLIAACHVLLRLLAPRHSLCALHSLIPFLKSATQRQLPSPPLAGEFQKPRHALPVLSGRPCGPASLPDRAVKIICIWDSNIFPRPLHERLSRATSFLAVKKNFFLHVDVKERTKPSVVFSSVTKE